MGHNIGQLDIQAGIERAWHGLTRVVEGRAIEMRDAFPYEIERKPLFVNTGKFRKVTGFSVFVSNDNGEVIGKPVADTYHALSNAEFWSVCRDALAGTGATIESAGTIFDRARRFLTIKLGDDATKIGGREFLSRISMIDSIDGSTRFFMVNTSVCVVCHNTSRMAMGDMTGEFNVSMKHTKGLGAKINGMERQIESMLGVKAQFEAALQMAASEPLTVDNARPLFAGWLGEGAERLSTQAVNTTDELVALYRTGAGNRGETLLDGVSAVTDFYSHFSSRGEKNEGFKLKQWTSSEFGAGARAKTDFLSALFVTEKGIVRHVNRDNIATLTRNGARLLADYAAAN